ncbi:MAG: hypothetical protein CSB44_13040 [Gammaproteobacteria bacterium]|nr:MAG: hypothetical protein CSB44_13040 [Gammaproteobacteria bacterium]
MSAVPDNQRAGEPSGADSAVRLPDGLGRSAKASGRPSAAEAIRLRTRALRLEMLGQRQAAVLSVVAGVLDAGSIDSVLLGLANNLQARFRCTRVLVATEHRGTLRVRALSQHDRVDPGSSELRLACRVMQAAIDADRVLQHMGDEPVEDLPVPVEEWLMQRETRQICVVPMVAAEKTIGALLLETEGRPRWSPATVELVQQIAVAVAPVIALRERAEQGLVAHAQARLHERLGDLVAPRFLVAKLAVAMTVVMLLVAALLPVTHRVTAEARLVASERRLLAAPRAGQIEQVQVVLGERVSAGQPLLALEATELAMEIEGMRNQQAALRGEMRAAMAEADRSELALLMAKQSQLDAEITLLEKRLERSVLRAPIDGIVVNGELEQALGATVERGDTLVEIAPDETYAVHLLVDERDVQRIAAGQHGALSLAANPSEQHAIEVTSVHPMSEPAGGQNRFRVEAALLDPDPAFRAGQSGWGKLDVGDASLLWVWTHGLSDWLRLKLWEWGW